MYNIPQSFNLSTICSVYYTRVHVFIFAYIIISIIFFEHILERVDFTFQLSRGAIQATTLNAELSSLFRSNLCTLYQ